MVPSRFFTKIIPEMIEANPEAICWKDEFKLINPPLFLGKTEDVIIANAGMNRPDTNMKNNVDATSAW